jgi:iron(III) transport system substrate-binding protein
MIDTEVEAGTPQFYKAIAAAARAEGPLTYYDGAYGGRLKVHRLLYERLAEKTGSEVIDWYTGGQEQMIVKVANQVHSGNLQFDVLQAQDFAIWRTLRHGQHLLSYFPPELSSLRMGASDPQGYSHHVSGSTHVPMYNPKRLSPDQLPKSWDEFLKPRWKDRICFLAVNQRVPIHRLFAWLYAVHGPEYIVGFAGQRPKEAKIGDLLMDLLESGEADLIVTVGAPRIIEAKRQGKSIEYFIPKEGVWYMRSYVGINARTTKPTLAKLFIRYLLSKEAQQILVENDFEAARTDMRATPEGYPPIEQLEKEGRWWGDSSPFWIDAQDMYQRVAFETYQDAILALNDKRTLNFQRLVDRVPGELPGDGYYDPRLKRRA